MSRIRFLKNQQGINVYRLMKETKQLKQIWKLNIMKPETQWQKNLGYVCYFYLVKVIEKCEDCLLSSTKYLLGIVSEHY